MKSTLICTEEEEDDDSSRDESISDVASDAFALFNEEICTHECSLEYVVTVLEPSKIFKETPHERRA